MAAPIEFMSTLVGGGRRRWMSMREDVAAPNVAYYGLSEVPGAPADQPVWIIVRETADAVGSSVFEVGRTNGGVGPEFQTLVWDDREDYFPPAPGNSLPLDALDLQGIGSGLITVVSLSDAAWTPLPAVSKPGRKAMGIQNISGFDLKIQYDVAPDPGYVGLTIANGNERYYAYTDGIIVYARLAPGSGTASVIIEELGN